MARKRPQQRPLVVHVPNLDRAVRRGRQQQMPGPGEEAQRGDSLGMVLPRVDLLLGDVIRHAARLLAQVNIEVLRNVHVRPALVIRLLGAMERRCLLAHGLHLLPPRQRRLGCAQHRPALHHVIFAVVRDLLVLLVAGQRLALTDDLVLFAAVPCPGAQVRPVALYNRRVAFALAAGPYPRVLLLDSRARLVLSFRPAFALDGAVFAAESVF